MKKTWTYGIISIIACLVAVVFAFLAGQESEFPEYQDPDPDPDPDNQDPKDKNDRDGKE